MFGLCCLPPLYKQYISTRSLWLNDGGKVPALITNVEPASRVNSQSSAMPATLLIISNLFLAHHYYEVINWSKTPFSKRICYMYQA